MKFTGHERDLNDPAGAGDDLDYMHARHCSPVTARFTSVDPAGAERLTTPQTWARYAYANNNPLKFIDPDGREAVVHEGGLVIDSVTGRMIYWGQDAYEVAENYNKTHTFQGIATTLLVVLGVISSNDNSDEEPDQPAPEVKKSQDHDEKVPAQSFEEIEKRQRDERKRNNPDKIYSIEKSKQRDKLELMEEGEEVLEKLKRERDANKNRNPDPDVD